MAFIRFISLVLIVISLMLLGADVVSTLERNGETFVRSFDHILMVAGVDAKPWLQQKLPPELANALIVAMAWPGWAVLGIPGTIFGLLTSGPRGRRAPLPPPAPPPPSPPISR